MTKRNRKPDLETPADDVQDNIPFAIALEDSELDASGKLTKPFQALILPPTDHAKLRLFESGILTAAESDRPQFRPGHLEHLAAEYVRLGKQEAWRLYADDLTVAFAFYADEFEALVENAGGG